MTISSKVWDSSSNKRKKKEFKRFWECLSVILLHSKFYVQMKTSDQPIDTYGYNCVQMCGYYYIQLVRLSLPKKYLSPLSKKNK